MNIKKSEMRTIRLLAVLIGIAVIAYGGWLSYQYVLARQSDQIVKEFKRDKRFKGSMHQTLTLDSKKDVVAIPDGDPVGVNYDWSGVMQVTVDSYKVFDSPKEAGLKVGEYGVAPTNDKKSKFALVTFTLKNVSATPSGILGNRDGYSASVFHHNATSEIDYFNLVTHAHSEHEYLNYELGIGEEKQIELGFYLDPDSDVNSPEFVIGIDGSAVQYHIPLVEEMEGDKK